MYKAVIIDDDPLVLEGLKTALDWSSFHFEIVFESTSPLLALEYLRNHPAQLVLTDISMPEMNGIELIRQAKQINPELSILILSAYDTFDYVRAAMRHGAENYLLKPLCPDELAESLRSVSVHLQERRKINNIYGFTMQTFRCNFIESWVHDSLSDDEFQTRAELLGINLQCRSYVVMIFTAAADDIPMLLDTLINLLLEKYLSHFYLENASQLVCIICSPDSSLDTEQLFDTVERMRPTLSYPFFVAVGPAVDNYSSVSDSYFIARKHLLLQHSSIPGINCQEFEIPVIANRLIEQPFLDIDEDTYIRNMLKLIMSPVTSVKRMGYEFAIINWGINQCNFDSGPDESIQKLLAEIEYNVDNTEKVEAYLRRFFRTVRSILEDHRENQSRCYPVVDAVIAAVQDHSNQNISLKTLATSLKIHPSYLGSIFHQQTGLYFNDYLNNIRLEYAAQLMEETDMKMKEIVKKSGFSSQTYFNRLFKQKYGVPPLSYRTKTSITTQKK